jgi:integrase
LELYLRCTGPGVGVTAPAGRARRPAGRRTQGRPDPEHPSRRVEGLRFHDLRHTAATLAVAAGASTRELMVRMGHSSSAAALRYQHVMAGRDAAIAAALDELVRATSTRSEKTAAE